MKYFIKRCLVLVAMVGFIGTTFAQELTVRSAFYSDDEGIYPSVEAKFPVSAEEISEDFEQFVEDTYNIVLKEANLGRKGYVLYANDILFREIDPNEVDVYINIVDNSDNESSTLDFVINRGGDYIDKWYDKDAYQDMRNLMLGFVYNKFPEYYSEEVSKGQVALQNLDGQADVIEEQLDDKRSQLDERYMQISKLSSEIINLKKNLRELEFKMQAELDEVEKDNSIFLMLNK